MKRIAFFVCVLGVSLLTYGAGRSATNAVRRISTTNTVAHADIPPPANDGRCEAITKSGNRCKRKAVRSERFCRQHLKIQQKKEEKVQ